MLLNKDGSVYRLSGPNPVMKDQKIWADFVTHNMKWNPEVGKDNTVVKPHESDFFVKESFLDALEAAKEEIKVTENVLEASSPEVRTPMVQHDPKNDIVDQEQIEKTFIHCLPAKIQERRDALYGDVYKTVKYGSPLSFEAVVISHTDFSFEIWTDTDRIDQGSILYPKTGYKRWWKVQDKSKKENGWILKSIPSDYQPSFDL